MKNLQKIHEVWRRGSPCLVFGIAAMFAGPGGAYAQDSDAEEEIFTLTPFEVTAEDQGYRASTSLAGTRLRTELQDIGSAISVYTEELMEDVGAVDNQTLLAYGLSTEVGGPRGNFVNANSEGIELDNTESPNSNTRIRGLTRADNTRNYFLTDVPWDGYAISRVDVQRGANSVLFGLGSPAGIVNASVTDAKFDDETEVQVRTDQFGSFRISLDHNQEVIEDELAVRFMVMRDNTEYRQKPAYETDERLFGALTYAPSFLNGDSLTTKIKANFESGSIEGNRPRSVVPVDNVSNFFLGANETGLGAPFDTMEAIQSHFGGGALAPNLNGQTVDTIAYDQMATNNNTSGTPIGMWTVRIPNNNPVLQFDGGQLVRSVRPGATGLGGFIDIGSEDEPNVVVTDGVNTFGDIDSDVETLGAFFIDGVRRTAADLGLPFQGFWNDKSFRDTSRFDFFNNMIDGDNKLEQKDWDVFEVDFAQTFFGSKLGYNLTFFHQSYKSRQDSLLGSLFVPAVSVDISSLDLTATPENRVANPYGGRAFIESNLNDSGGRIREIDRTSARFQAFYSHDFAENSEGMLARVLGKHDIVAVAQTREKDSLFRNFRPVGWAPEAFALSSNYVPDDLRQLGPDATLLNYDRIGVAFQGVSRFYLDANGSSLTGLQPLGDFEVVSGPVSFTAFDPRPRTGFTVDDALEPWANPFLSAPDADLNNPEDPGTVESQQINNPDNFRGFQDGFATFNLVRATESAEALRYLTRQFNYEEESVDSKAAVWTGRFWDNSIVGMFGWREDDQEVHEDRFLFGQVVEGVTEEFTLPWNDGSGNPATRNVGQTWDHYDPSFPDAEQRGTKVQTRNWSAKANLTRLFGLEDALPVSFHVLYNEGEVVEPAASRVDAFGRDLPNPVGTTEDASFVLMDDKGKWSLRVTKYETIVDNARSQQGIQNSKFLLEQTMREGSRGAWRIENDNGNYTAGFLPLSESAAAAGFETEGEYRTEVMAPAWRQFELDLIEQFPLTQGWFVDGFTGPEDQFENLRGQGRRATLFPNGAQLVEQQISKGWELELTANPLRNWNVAFNASQTEAIRDGAPGEDFGAVVDFMIDQLRNTAAGEIPVFWFGGTPTSDLINPFVGELIRARALNGAEVPEVREWKANLITNYRFNEGRFSGLGVGGAVRWEDSQVFGFQPFTTPEGNTDLDLDQKFEDDSRETVDLWFSYRKKLGNDKLDWKIQLNLRNVFGENELVPLSVNPDGSVALMGKREGTSWELSNTFSF